MFINTTVALLRLCAQGGEQAAYGAICAQPDFAPGGQGKGRLWLARLAGAACLVADTVELVDCCRGMCALLVAQPQAGLNALEGAARLFATALTQCAREGMPQGALAQMAVVLRGYKGAMGEGPWGALWGGLALPTREELRKVIPEQPL